MHAIHNPSAAPALLPPAMEQTLLFMEQHLAQPLAQPLAMPALARTAQCSPATLNRLFRKHLGMPPNAFLMKKRMDRAASLLHSTSLRMGEVGQVVGMPDPFYFSRLFKKTYGMTASQYRSQHALFEK
ncbi:MAG: helix-turn-helix transcriptional regulator [Verrucomicrobiae bacterium]|nr:helix-turn-helix transcriptional regulator [Verrucomicrobiae bacterium]